MKLNINERVTVVLTDFGAEILNSLNFPYTNRTFCSGDIYKEQLWYIMNVFGEHVSLGKLSPFEDAEIIIGEH